MTVPEYTNSEMLVKVRAAIYAALDNKAYSISGRSFTKHDLSQLREMERHYSDAVAAEAGSRRPAVARFREPL